MSPQDRKHGRDAAHRRAAQAAAREVARRKRRRLQATIVGGVAIVVIAAVSLTTISGDDDATNAKATSPSTTESSSSSSTTAKKIDESPIPDDPKQTVSAPFVYGTGACPPESKPATSVRTFDDAPKRCLKDDVDYRAVVDTSEGSFTIDLLEHRAPGTVNNFVVLARYAFFDGLTFHRVVPGFVIQGGDPNGDGSGGPGYKIPDEWPPAVASYHRYAVAMANSGPASGGSQWFVCEDCSQLPSPLYSLFGQVVAGTDVVDKIDALGDGDGPPTKPVTINTVTIQEG
jgi:cyclophilin family peptidyl-prolyl cis-trans isomerase